MMTAMLSPPMSPTRSHSGPLPLTVDEWESMTQTSLFDGRRIELLDGVLYEGMSPLRFEHADSIRILERFFAQLLVEAKADFWSQQPLVLDETASPEPDFALVGGDLRSKLRPEDVFLGVEMCLTTQAKDFAVKVPLSARAGVRKLWILNLRDRVLRLYRELKPDAWGFACVAELITGATAVSLAFHEISIPLAELLPLAPKA